MVNADILFQLGRFSEALARYQDDANEGIWQALHGVAE